MQTLRAFFIGLILLPTVAVGQIISDTLLWDYNTISVPGGTGHALKTGNAFDLAISGGTSNANSVFLGTTSVADLNFLKLEQGQALKISLPQLAITGNTTSDTARLIILSLTTKANTSPYNDGAKAISLLIRGNQDGTYQLGWKDAGAIYPYSKNTLESGKTLGVIEGIDLILTATTYEFVITTSTRSISLTGEHGITDDWGNLGLNLLLQKGVAGDYNVNATIGSLTAEIVTIPEARTSMLLTLTVVGGFAVAIFRNRSRQVVDLVR